MGISTNTGNELSELFNHWAQVRITDNELKKLIRIAMAPNKEVLNNLQNGNQDDLSAIYTNVIDKVYEYAMSSPTQQVATAAGTVFGAYNAVTGYFQNVRNYKDGESKFKSIIEGTAKLRAQSAFGLCRDFAALGAQSLILN